MVIILIGKLLLTQTILPIAMHFFVAMSVIYLSIGCITVCLCTYYTA